MQDISTNTGYKFKLKHFFVVALIYICAICAWAETAVPSPSPSPNPLPDFVDSTAVTKWAKKASLAERTGLYFSYLDSKLVNRSTTSVLEDYLIADLPKLAEADRLKLANRIIDIARKAGPAKYTPKDVDGNTKLILPEYMSMHTWLNALALSPDSAIIYWQALPINVAKDDYYFNTLDLSGKATTVLAGLLPDKLPKLTASTSLRLMEACLDWPAALDRSTFDALSMKKILFSLWQGGPELYEVLLVDNHSRSGDTWKNLKLSRVEKSKPTEAEWQSVLLNLLRTRSMENYQYYNSVAWWQPQIPTKAELKDWLPWLKKRAESTDLRTRALARLILVLNAEPTEKMTDWMPTSQEIAATTDDWTAWALIWTANAREIHLTGADFLSCLDAKRPMLMGSALEIRYGAPVSGGSDKVERRLAPGATPPPRETEVDASEVIKRCLAIKNGSNMRLLMPAMGTVMYLGGGPYLKQIIVLFNSPFRQLRYYIGQAMLTFADTSMYQYFAAHLFDSEDKIRQISIQGIGKIRDSRGVDDLAKILNNPMEPNYLRLEAAEALGRIGDRRMVQIFATMLARPADGKIFDNNVRIFAAQQLGALREKTAVGALLQNIDITKNTQLNYYCIEALGKINDRTGLARFAELFQKAYPEWQKENGGNSTWENVRCSLWSLMLFKSDILIAWYQKQIEVEPKVYNRNTYFMTWYLCRNVTPPPEAALAYCTEWRAKFFEQGPDSLALLMEKDWDMLTLQWLAANSSLKWGDVYITWLLSGMCNKPDITLQPAIMVFKDSTDESVRGWTAHLAALIARKLSTSPVDTVRTQGTELLTIIDAWLATETYANAKSWLNDAKTKLNKFKIEPVTTGT